jgi:N-acetyl-anhydromuramyl-L-alanine amidase AmpD
MKIIDFSNRAISPHLIRAAGFDGVVAYVSESRPGSNFAAKPLRRQYADALRAEGLEIVSNFQFGKPGSSTPSDFTRGFAGGVADATTALRLHAEAGGPDHAPIIFRVDDDIDLVTWNDLAVNWFRGINSVLGVGRTGIYGHSRVCAWAIQDEVVGRSTTPGFSWAWQTKAWSQGEREPAAVLFQGVTDTPSNPGPLVEGTRVDVNDVLAADFGQWGLDRSSSVAVLPPQFDESDEIRSPYCGPRQADIIWFVLHTEDGDSGSARNLARYLSNNDRSVSYHFTVDNDCHVYDVVDTNLMANSVFEPGNSRSINLAFADSKANWSRETWLERMKRGIDIAAYIAVRETRRHGLRPQIISRAQVNRWESGITDHGAIVEATHVGDHTDVGLGFPWDYFTQKVNEFATGRRLVADIPVRAALDAPVVTVVRGDVGSHVTSIQTQLNDVSHAGLLLDGEFADRTFRAVTKFQTSRGLVADGKVDARTWRELFSNTPARVTAPRRNDVIDGVEPFHSFDVTRTADGLDGRTTFGRTIDIPQLDAPDAAIALDGPPYKWITGKGVTTSVDMEYADLGIMRWDPDRSAIAAMFGDNFRRFWGDDWQSPSIVMYNANYDVIGVPTTDGIRMRPRRPLWNYPHNNPDFDTVLPCDFIRVNGWWYVAVMLSKGPLDVEGAQRATEFWRSPDLINWQFWGPKLWHNPGSHRGNTMLTFDQIGDYVYIFGTGGIIRNKEVWMWRNKASEFPHGLWEPWGWDGFRWEWGIPNEETPILRGWYGELSFRYVDSNCVLSYLEGGRMTARTVKNPEDNWQDGAHLIDYVHDYEIERLYGGYISPLSHLNQDGGMKFFVSQWNGTENYRVYLVESTLWATGPLGLDGPPPAGLDGLDNPRIDVADDLDQFPLPPGCYWGPLDGPDESWSNLAGTEPRYSIDGLARWQQTIGVDATGVYDNATKEVTAHMQYILGWLPSLGSAVRGVIREQEWDEVIRNGWRIPATEPADPPTGQSPREYEIGWYPGPGYDDGHGEYLRIYLHTTENQDWISKAEDVAIGQAMRRDGSYHFLVDDYHVIQTVPTEDTAWGLHLDNPVSIQIAMVGTSGAIGCWLGNKNPNVETNPKTREQWLAHAAMLDMVAFTIAKVATQQAIPIEWLDIQAVEANRPGVSSHYNYSYGSAVLHEDTLHGKQDTNHWDVPPEFPVDVVIGIAKAYTGRGGASAIDEVIPTPAKAPAKAPTKKAAANNATKTPPAKAVKAAHSTRGTAPRTQGRRVMRKS